MTRTVLHLVLLAATTLPLARCATFGAITEEDLRELGDKELIEDLARFEREGAY